MKVLINFFIFKSLVFFSYNSIADDTKAAKDGIISKFTDSLSLALSNVIGGEGDDNGCYVGPYYPKVNITITD